MAAPVQSEVEVANMALDMVREAPISSFEENRAAARWMDRNFATYRDFVLASYHWKFAATREVLLVDPAPPAFGWAHRHKKPPDCLRVLPIRFRGRIDGALIPFEVEGKWILSNEAGDLWIKYVRRVEASSEYNQSPHFIAALAARLAGGIAHWMTGKSEFAKQAQQNYKDAMMMAKTIDSMEGFEPEQYNNAYDEPRYSGFGEGRWNNEGPY